MILGKKNKEAPPDDQPKVIDVEFEEGGDEFEGQQKEYQEAYSDDKYWTKLKSSINKLPADMKLLIEKALVLYYCAKDHHVPTHVKAVIIGALGYFIVPLDVVPDMIPVMGLIDDLAVLLVAYRYIEEYITSAHRESARVKMDTLFERSPEPDGAPVGDTAA